MSEAKEQQLGLIVCGTVGWGIGSYTYMDGEPGQEEECYGYGFPWPGMNPNDFHPDAECCTEAEIAKHAQDKKEWK